MLITEYKVESRYPDCDRMGVVHHAVYPVWYEAARIDWLEKAGFPFALSQEKHVNPAMVELNIRYLAAVGYPEEVTITVTPELLAPKKLALTYRLTKADGTEAGTARSFHIWTGPDNKSYHLQDKLPEIYAALSAAVSDSVGEQSE